MIRTANKFNKKRITLSHGRFLTACYSRAQKKSDRWLVFLQESGAEFQIGHRRELELLVGRKLAQQFNYLIVNKPGLHPGGVNEPLFERSFRRNLRVADAQLTLKKVVPFEDKILLVGYSEGAYLAPEVALNDPRVEAVVMIGGGTRGWLKEELSNARKSDRRKIRKQILEIEASPKSRKKWLGFSYATWCSYKEDRTLESLRRLHTPALAILGKRDRTIDFKSTVRDLKRLRHQRHWIEIEVIRNCGHSFKGHWGSVRRTLKKYVSSLAFKT